MSSGAKRPLAITCTPASSVGSPCSARAGSVVRSHTPLVSLAKFFPNMDAIVPGGMSLASEPPVRRDPEVEVCSSLPLLRSSTLVQLPVGPSRLARRFAR